MRIPVTSSAQSEQVVSTVEPERSGTSERSRARLTQRRLLRESRSVRLPIIGTVGLGLVTVVLIIAQAVLLARVIAAVFIEGQGLDAVAGDLLALALISIGRGLADAGFESVGRIGAAQVMGDLRMRLASHALRRPLSATAHRPAGERSDDTEATPDAGELVAAAIDGVDSLEAWFARYLPQVVLSVLAPLAILAWLIPLDWPAAMVLLVTAPLIPLFMILIGLATEHRARRRWRLMARLSSHFLDRVSGLETLRIHGLADSQTAAIEKASDEYRRETMATLRIGFLSALVLELLAMLGTAIVAATVGIQLAGGHLELATGLCVLLLAPELYMPLRRLGTEFHAGAEGLAAAERIFAALGPAETEAAGDSLPQQPRSGASRSEQASTVAIHLEDIHFGYPQRERVLAGASLTIEPGEHVAIVGPSGCGKSTLITQLLGLLQPDRGEVRIQASGRPQPRSFDLGLERDRAAWHRRVAWVPQRPTLIAGTLADNVRLLAPGAGDDEVAAAIGKAGLSDLIRDLERGQDTQIGEGGRRLSAGQRQRVALARAFLRDAPFVLLDEPTAHLDRETAADVMAAIEELLVGRTALIATHRSEALAVVDRVLEMRGGRLYRLDSVPERELSASDSTPSGRALAVSR